MSQPEDRNFDDLAERFESRVYGSIKGEIRRQVIWRDLLQQLPELNRRTKKPLRILDIGGGLGQFTTELAQAGHLLVFNDLSEAMMIRAQRRAHEVGVADRVQWLAGPYQKLDEHIDEAFDLILCHAVIEWLAQPEALIPALTQWLKSGALLSLCCYNPVSKIYRNLIRGNFRWVQQQAETLSDNGSLTPNFPSSTEDIKNWLGNAGLTILQQSGIRVFSDYVVDRRGGNDNPAAVVEMELLYSNQSPYREMGRYQHFMAQKTR
jgi:S-adenosylmethionine-dependent methyltransferase